MAFVVYLQDYAGAGEDTLALVELDATILWEAIYGEGEGALALDLVKREPSHFIIPDADPLETVVYCYGQGEGGEENDIIVAQLVALGMTPILINELEGEGP